MKLALLFAGLVAATALHATPVYNNTTGDTGDTAVYSTGQYSEIGDRILLAGTDRIADTAAAQFFNNGSDGSFVATLKLYGLGQSNAGVGALLGSFTAASMSLAAGSLAEVSWSLAGLPLLPDELFFTVTVDRFSSGMDLGLTVFDPPTVGSSSDQFFLVKDANGFAQASFGSGHDNIYFRLDATGDNRIPEPGSAGLVLLAMLPLLAMRGRRSVLR